jgi:hypothetical protein
VLCCVVLRCVALRCVALRCVALRCVALRCVMTANAKCCFPLPPSSFFLVSIHHSISVLCCNLTKQQFFFTYTISFLSHVQAFVVWSNQSLWALCHSNCTLHVSLFFCILITRTVHCFFGFFRFASLSIFQNVNSHRFRESSQFLL